MKPLRYVDGRPTKKNTLYLDSFFISLVAYNSHCLCVSCVGRAPCVGRSLYVSGALCVGALCVGRSLVGPSPPVSDPRYVDIRSRDGSRSSARSHGHTTKAERRAAKQRQRRSASSGQNTLGHTFPCLMRIRIGWVNPEKQLKRRKNTTHRHMDIYKYIYIYAIYMRLKPQVNIYILHTPTPTPTPTPTHTHTHTHTPTHPHT